MLQKRQVGPSFGRPVRSGDAARPRSGGGALGRRALASRPPGRRNDASGEAPLDRGPGRRRPARGPARPRGGARLRDPRGDDDHRDGRRDPRPPARPPPARVAEIVGGRLAYNRSGANLLSGVASTLPSTPHAELGLFEVDEAALPEVTRRVRPRVLALGNLFRDQLDRYGELEHVAARW